MDVKKGDCLYVLQEVGSLSITYGGFFIFQEIWSLEPVIRIGILRKRGLYAPLTQSGRIIVNDVLVSCYSEYYDQTIQKTYFDVSLIPFPSHSKHTIISVYDQNSTKSGKLHRGRELNCRF